MIAYRSISDMASVIRSKISTVPHDLCCVVGVPRSGMLAATIIALYRHVPVTDLDSFVSGRVHSSGKRRCTMRAHDASGAVLVIDDSVSSGKSMLEAKKRIASSVLCQGIKINYGAVFCAPESRSMIDVCFEEVQNFRVFEWNVFHSIHLANACIDIDGILCRDPTEDENDDGENYKHFLCNASPKIIPTVKLGTLVSSRLEKYRKETEKWLCKHGVIYESLVLLDGYTAEQRRRLQIHAKFKAGVYAESEACLFIESCKTQALEIAKISHKPVLAFEDMHLYSERGTFMQHHHYGYLKTIVGKIKRMYWRHHWVRVT